MEKLCVLLSAGFQHTASSWFGQVMLHCTLLAASYVAGKEEDFEQTSDQTPVTELCIGWSWNKRGDDLWWIISAPATNNKLFCFCCRKWEKTLPEIKCMLCLQLNLLWSSTEGPDKSDCLGQTEVELLTLLQWSSSNFFRLSLISEQPTELENTVLSCFETHLPHPYQLVVERHYKEFIVRDILCFPTQIVHQHHLGSSFNS